MKSLPEVLSVLKANKVRLQAKYPIQTMAVFGSVARNTQSRDSDIDVFINVAPEIGLGFIELAEERERLLSEKVDLISKRAIKPPYFSIIERDLVYV